MIIPMETSGECLDKPESLTRDHSRSERYIDDVRGIAHVHGRTFREYGGDIPAPAPAPAPASVRADRAVLTVGFGVGFGFGFGYGCACGFGCGFDHTLRGAAAGGRRRPFRGDLSNRASRSRTLS